MTISPKPIALAFLLALSGIGIAHASNPVGKQVTATIELQGGSESNARWKAPDTSSYKIHVFVPKNATTTNALYHIYPKGKQAGSTECLSGNAKFPCYEASIDQSQHQNAWTQLTMDNDPASQWEFVKGRGYVTAVASNLAAAELLNLSGLVRFENRTIAIGKTYQGGIIFYIDHSGEHGLVAAPKDITGTTDNADIPWWNGSFVTTRAIATAVGTGLANTNKIIRRQGAGSFAARLASKLVLNGYDDWFLPSKDELHLMYTNIGQGAAAPFNLGKFASSPYWSSSESINPAKAWSENFSLLWHEIGSKDKDSRYLVRAVRSF